MDSITPRSRVRSRFPSSNEKNDRNHKRQMWNNNLLLFFFSFFSLPNEGFHRVMETELRFSHVFWSLCDIWIPQHHDLFSLRCNKGIPTSSHGKWFFVELKKKNSLTLFSSFPRKSTLKKSNNNNNNNSSDSDKLKASYTRPTRCPTFYLFLLDFEEDKIYIWKDLSLWHFTRYTLEYIGHCQPLDSLLDKLKDIPLRKHLVTRLILEGCEFSNLLLWCFQKNTFLIKLANKKVEKKRKDKITFIKFIAVPNTDIYALRGFSAPLQRNSYYQMLSNWNGKTMRHCTVENALRHRYLGFYSHFKKQEKDWTS